MKDVSLIVVPIDFSAGSDATVQYAGWLAGRLGARVLLLHAFVGLAHASAGLAPGLIDDFWVTEASVRAQVR